MFPRRSSWIIVLVVVGLTGCAGSTKALERRMRDLETHVTRVQNENDRLVERVGSLELGRATAEQELAHDEPTVLERPPLKVIRMDPAHAQARTRESAPPTEPGPAEPAPPETSAPPAEAPADPKRPVLHIRGQKGGFRQSSGQSPRS